ncbi:MAG: hypothetical protein U1E46_02945 [Hyphomicrobiales bacterium]
MRSKLDSLTNMTTRTIETDVSGRGGKAISVLVQTFEATYVRVPDTETWAAKIAPGKKFGLRTYLARDGKMFRHVTNQLLFDTAKERDTAVDRFVGEIPAHLEKLKRWL